ncbi:MAG TPA: PHP domain-containing protein, partial [bacterium]|nr:PHP domain-containing protein [bacterium]
YAAEAGLAAVGIMDHDSIAGAAEMREAGGLVPIATTGGVELRVSAAGTALEGRKTNNPDSVGILYMIIHGVHLRSAPPLARFLAPLHAARESRGQRMVERLNGLLPGYGLPALSWEKDVRPLSRAAEGGSVTERHILFALARAILEGVGRGGALLSFLRTRLGIQLSSRTEGWLSDTANVALPYDLLGVLKSSFMDKVFIQPGPDECLPVGRVVALAEEVGGIATYPYLGDVTDSPTGDKKAERFEDGYLDELMAEVQRLGFRAIAYMPPRNTLPQLRRVQALCTAHGFMEISGVDINTPRQSFRCPELLLPEFAHLMDATWALIAHEQLSEAGPHLGLFSPQNPLAGLPLAERLARYARVGRALFPGAETAASEQPIVAEVFGRAR